MSAWRKTTNTRVGTSTIYSAADLNAIIDLLNGVDTGKAVAINNDWNFVRAPSGVGGAAGRSVPVHYYVYQDASDGNKFKARNTATGAIDYTSSGSTDATSVLQGAFTAASGLGAVFLDGAFPVNGSSPILTVPSNTHIIGAGNTTITAQAERGVIANVTRSGGGNSNIIIENITINGGWNGSSAGTSDACGILMDYVTDVTIRNCRIISAKAEGIKFRHATRTLAQGNFVNLTPVGMAGIIQASGTNYGQTIGNTCVDCGGESYSAFSGGNGPTTSHIIIANNIGYVTTTSENTRGHILIEGDSTSGAVYDCIIANNNIQSGFANCIILTNGNPSVTPLKRNILITGNTLTQIQGFTTYPGDPSGGCGIAGSCHGLTITNNIIHNVMGHGIQTSSGNNAVVIRGNTIRNVGLGTPYASAPPAPFDGINNTSTAFALYDNIISDNIILDENTNMRYGINMDGTGTHTNMFIHGNSIRGAQTTAIHLGAYGSTVNCQVISTLVGLDTTDTLTNKTLTSPKIASISSSSGTLTPNTSGTISVPNATDTLVAKATTDILTNKTIDAAANTMQSIVQQPFVRKYGIAYGASVVSAGGAIGLFANQTGAAGAGTNSNVFDNTYGAGLTYVSGAAQNNNGGWHVNRVITSLGLNPRLTVAFKLSQVGTDFRMWIGFSSNTASMTSDDPLNAQSGYMFGIVTTIASKFSILKNSGSGVGTYTNSGLADIDNTTIHKLVLVGDSTNSRWGWSLDGSAFTYDTTVIPAVNTGLTVHVETSTNTTAARNQQIYYAVLET